MQYAGSKLIELAKVLEQGISRSALVWHMGGICIGKGKAIVSNGYVVIEVPFDSSSFEGYIKGSIFVDSLKLLSEVDTFELMNVDGKLQVRNDRILIGFAKIGDYDSSKVIEGGGTAVAVSSDIFGAIKSVIPFVGVREVMPALRGISVKNTRVIASDNVRIASVKINGVQDGIDILLPFDGGVSLVAVAEGRTVQTIELLKDRNLLKFKFLDGVIVYVTLLGLEFPNLEIFMDSCGIGGIVIPQGFVEGIRRVCSCQEGSNKIIRLVGSGVDLLIDSGGNFGHYVERYRLEVPLTHDVNITLAAEDFLPVIENSNSFLFSEAGVVYFQGKIPGVKFAMMQIEVL